MNPAEQYAVQRQDAMVKAIMGHLRPTTLERIFRDLESVVEPPPEDVAQFIASAKRQVRSLLS